MCVCACSGFLCVSSTESSSQRSTEDRSMWKSDQQIQASYVRPKYADGLKISRCMMNGGKKTKCGMVEREGESG